MPSKLFTARGYGLPLIGVLFGVVFWILDALAMSAATDEGSLFQQLVEPDGHEIWLRLSVFALTSFMGFYGKRIVDRQTRAQVVAEASEQRFKDFADMAADWLWETDAEFRFTYVSSGFWERTGIPADSVLGKTRREWFGESEPRRGSLVKGDIETHLDTLQQHQAFDYFEYDWRLPNGKIRTLSTSGRPQFDRSGRFRGYRGIGRDVTERRRVQAELLKSREMLEETQRIAEIASWEWSMEGGCTGWQSSTYAQILGDESGGLLDTMEKLLSRMHPQDREAFIALSDETAANPRPYVIEYRVVRSDGSVRHIQERGQPVYDESGKAILFRGTCQDVTALREVERKLQASYSALARAHRNAKIVYWEWLGGQNIARYEPTADALMSDLPKGALTHDRNEFFSVVHPDDRQLVEQTYRDADRFGRDYSIEYRFVGPAGKCHYVLEIGTAEFDESGAFSGHTGTLQDITDLRLTEQALLQAQKMETVGQLTGGIAHDFNNLLSVILGNLEMLDSKLAKDGELRVAVHSAVTAAEKGADLTHRLLAFSRRQALRPEAIDAFALAEGMIEMLQRSLGETIEIEVIGQPNIWSCIADPVELESAILNLAVNARDAMPDGGRLTIEATNIALDEHAAAQADVAPGDYVLLMISDTGVGMTPDVVERAFEPFFTTKEVGKGSGLGLSMVYGFAKQSGGQARIYSEPGEGTVIRLYLPRAEQTRKPTTPRSPAYGPPRGNGERVFVVEDDAELRRLVVRLLRGLGYEVQEAGTGPAALEAMSNGGDIDLLLVDVVLPGGMNGATLAEAVRRQRPGLPVLYMSGYTQDALVHHGRLAEGVRLLRKPFRRATIAEAVRQAMAKAG